MLGGKDEKAVAVKSARPLSRRAGLPGPGSIIVALPHGLIDDSCGYVYLGRRSDQTENHAAHCKAKKG